MPTVSTIIPAFNCEKYIKETVESVFSQTHKDIELIVVDDCSTDDTGKILKAFGPRVICVRQEKNAGPTIARNRGIEMAKGKYVAFLDHDDIWAPTKLEKQIGLLEGDPDVALVYSDSFSLNASDSKTGTLFRAVRPERGFVFESLLFNHFIATSSVVIRKKVFDEIGKFNERYFISQDFDLYLRIAERHKIDFVDEPLFKYRAHPGGLSTKRRKLTLQEAIEISKRYRDKFLRSNPGLARKLDRRIAKYMFYISIWLLDSSNRREAAGWYLNSMKTKAFDYKIILGALFFVTPRFLSAPILKKLLKN